MPLSSLEQVRTFIGDLSKIAVNESVTEQADGSTRIFQLDMFPVRTGSISRVTVSGRVISGVSGNFPLGTIDFASSTVSGNLPPTAGAQIVVTYQYNALSDDEIQYYIDLASGNGNIVAASLAARGLASNFARFFAYSQGDKSVDKRFMARHLIDIAESLEKAHENAITHGGTSLTVASFDDSGTVFDGYDTASSVLITGTS